MTYIVTTTAGQTLTTVTDNTVNTTSTSLTLVGKNYAGYGIFINENFVQLLENFSNTIPPVAPLTGQLWYDSTNTLLKFYTGSDWKPIHTSAAAASAPTSPVIGDLWFNTLTSQLHVRGSSDWVVVGPAFTATAGTSGAIVETILDTSALSHVVVKLYVSNQAVAIFSKDATFTPQTSIPGFATINPGLNLISTGTLAGTRLWGDATNSFYVNNISSGSFLRSDEDDSNGTNKLSVGKLQAGSDLLIDPTTSDVQIFSNGPSVYKDIGIYVNKGGSQTKAIGISGATAATTLLGNTSITVGTASTSTTSGALIVTGGVGISGALNVGSSLTVTGSLLPSANNTISIGSTSSRFANVWATTFRGTSVQANYADLAERFEADIPMLPGTVVELGGIKEITAAVQELSEKVFGVISTLPGFLLNGAAGTNETHPPIAVNGRVPVRVIGKIAKGDRLVSAGRGLARSASREEMTAFNVLGRALENKTTDGEGTIEAIVKLNS